MDILVFKVDVTLGVLTCTYPHKPLKKIKMYICNHQVDSPFGVWFDVCPGDLQAKKKNLVLHDTECPYWGQLS